LPPLTIGVKQRLLLAVDEVGCFYQPVIVNGRHPNKVTEFRWINTVLSNLKTSFSGTLHHLRFDKYDDRYLSAFSYRFNRRFDLAAITKRVLHAACQITARPEGLLRRSELTALIKYSFIPLGQGLCLGALDLR
jgi:hypothetical protein